MKVYKQKTIKALKFEIISGKVQSQIIVVVQIVFLQGK